MLFYLVVGVVAEWAAYEFMGIVGLVLGYLLLGFVWYQIFWLAKPVTHRGPAPMFWLVLAWPYALLLGVRERSLLLKHPQRFTVLYGDTGQSKIVPTPFQISFGSWDEALEFAKAEAAKSGHDAAISDMAEYGVSRHTGEPMCVMHSISPSGSVNRVTA